MPAEEPSVTEEMLRLAEAVVFASATPVSLRSLSRLMPDGTDIAAVVDGVRQRFLGRGIELTDVAGGLSFRTASDLAPALRKVIEVPRRLPRVAMETLAIVAYHQPITRNEIETLRGSTLSQQTFETLLEADLITPKGRRETPGRPTLWGTTPNFLLLFGLTDLRELPRREDLFIEPPATVHTENAGEPDAADARDPPGDPDPAEA
jgi:segregation and condensation protein B